MGSRAHPFSYLFANVHTNWAFLLNQRVLKNCIRALFSKDQAIMPLYLMARVMVQNRLTPHYTATGMIAVLRIPLEMEHKRKEIFDEYTKRYEE